jgi:hypothetical protein
MLGLDLNLCPGSRFCIQPVVIAGSGLERDRTPKSRSDAPYVDGDRSIGIHRSPLRFPGCGRYNRPMRCDICKFDWQAPRQRSVDTLGTVSEQVHLPADIPLDERPTRAVWSIVEYLAHLRDAITFYDTRIRLIVGMAEPPVLSPWNPDEACEQRRYQEVDPHQALIQAVESGQSLQGLLVSMSDVDLLKFGIGSDGGSRTAEELANRAAHEIVHHSYDIVAVSQALSAARA